MTIIEYIKKKIMGIVGLKRDTGTDDVDRLTFINDEERLVRSRLKEYNIWYEGDGDELLNYYTNESMIGYNEEPFYSRNKKEYFWSRSATESDVKRTHSGLPRIIVDTLTMIIRFPQISVMVLEDSRGVVGRNLESIIKANELSKIYNKQLALTLVEGWGCYKINWDMEVSEYPIVEYYRAENVDYIYKYGMIVGVIFKDYYTGEKNRKYLLTETRRLSKGNLIIERELFTIGANQEYIKEEDFGNVPELKDIDKYIEIENLGMLWAVPSVLFENLLEGKGGYGRSIFTGKSDLFDDLDQALSQAANSVRKSTVVEYFNSDFLERDRNTGLPKQPHSYDRKYSVYQGQRDGNGGSTSSAPVQTTQPTINFEQYSEQAMAITTQIIQGIMSPATLGISISKKDNAQAQREKEKITIFTRNGIIDEETRILKKLCSELLCAYEFMKTGYVTCKEYDISVKFSEFANDSYENKLKILTSAYDSSSISDDMFMKKLYGDTLSKEEYDKELEWLKEHHTQPRDDGWLGAAGDGENFD